MSRRPSIEGCNALCRIGIRLEFLLPNACKYYIILRLYLHS
nr:MAG TPA: hypothetical protein [Caudoviricetes sp.]